MNFWYAFITILLPTSLYHNRVIFKFELIVLLPTFGYIFAVVLLVQCCSPLVACQLRRRPRLSDSYGQIQIPQRKKTELLEISDFKH